MDSFLKIMPVISFFLAFIVWYSGNSNRVFEKFNITPKARKHKGYDIPISEVKQVIAKSSNKEIKMALRKSLKQRKLGMILLISTFLFVFLNWFL